MAKKKTPRKSKTKTGNSQQLKYWLLFLILILGIVSAASWLYYEMKESSISIVRKEQSIETPENETDELIPIYTYVNEKRDNSPSQLTKLDSLKSLSEFLYCKSSFTDQIIDHTYFSLAYVEDHEQARWVSYRLPIANLAKVAERSNRFKSDPLVPTYSAHPDDYKNTGYDRGHLAPAGDFTFSKTAMDETFYMSNMSPQAPGFNRGIWKKLEEQVRRWAVDNDELYIITGPVLEEKLTKIGDNGVSVPKYYYKIIYDLQEPELKAIAFILPNESSNKNLIEFCHTVDSLENLLQIDFLPFLPDSIERKIEGSLIRNQWFK
jgi:endonuclease G, mitochondrial